MIATEQQTMTQPELITAPEGPRAISTAEAMNPLMLLQQAVDRGMSPDQLKALVDLHEQWRAARAKEAFNAAMTAVQIEMPCIVRDAQNTQTKSTYVRLETVTHQAKPVYTRHGFALSFSEDRADRENWKRIVCDITHIQGHSERRWIDLPVDGIGAKGNAIGAMNPVQGAVSTGSYGQRVLTCRIFNITIADSDLDGQSPNPVADASAPKARPRGKREQSPEPIVTSAQLGHISSEWKTKNPEPFGDVQKQRASFAEWVKRTCGRDFDPIKPAQWLVSDYHACCAALKIPTLEDLQRDASA